MSLSRSQSMNTQSGVSSKSVKVMSTNGEEFNLTLEKLNLDLKNITDGIDHMSQQWKWQKKHFVDFMMVFQNLKSIRFTYPNCCHENR